MSKSVDFSKRGRKQKFARAYNEDTGKECVKDSKEGDARWGEREEVVVDGAIARCVVLAVPGPPP